MTITYTQYNLITSLQSSPSVCFYKFENNKSAVKSTLKEFRKQRILLKAIVCQKQKKAFF